MIRYQWLTVIIAIAFTLGMGFSSPKLLAASTLDVFVTDEGFDPQVVRITPNTTMTWTCLEGVHTTTSVDGLWDSGVMVPNMAGIPPPAGGGAPVLGSTGWDRALAFSEAVRSSGLKLGRSSP